MTGNQIKGRGFRGALRYNLEKVGKNVAEVLDHSFAHVSEKSIMKEIQMIRVLRPNLQKYFYHTSINFPPGEDLTNNQMKAIGLEYLKENGFTQHQFIMFRHYDSDHPHLHILVNRIGYDGTVLSDSNDYARSESVLRKLEQKYRLTAVVSSRQARERAMTKNEMEMMKRTNNPSQKMQLQVLVKNILQSRKLTCDEFINALERKGIQPLFNQASTGYVSGISYSYQGFVITGAKLGNDFKWASIKNSIDYEQERDRKTIHETNLRTRSAATVHGPTATGQTHGRNPKSVQPGHGTSPAQSSASVAQPGSNLPAPAQRAAKAKQPGRKSGYIRQGSSSQSQSGPAAPNLASLLLGDISRVLFSVDNVDHSSPGAVLMTDEELRKRKKKKRRRLSR